MKIDTKKLEKLRKWIKNLSKNEYESKVLMLNGLMNKKLFDNVFNDLQQLGNMDPEHFSYCSERYNISEQDCWDFIYYIDKFCLKYKIKKHIDKYNIFPNWIVYLKYNNIKFTLWSTSGQGTAYFLEIYKGRKKCTEIFIDRKIKFYRELKNEI